MKIGSHEYVDDLPPLVANGLELSAELHRHNDERMHIYFEHPDLAPHSSYDYTRVGYRDFGGESMLLGLRVASKLRGSGLGQSMIKYFLERLEERGQTFAGTGYIYKPLIALTLKRAGMEPLSDEVLVEILPWSKYEDSGVPRIRVVRNETEEELTGERPFGGHFYEVVPDDEAMFRYPTNSPEMIVALNTRYIQ